MPWPMAAAYAETLQNPALCFKRPDLKQSKIKVDANGQPLGLCGAFAVVFKASLKNGSSTAIRAFTSERPETTTRYKAISGYLRLQKQLKSMVRFEYYAKGIKAVDSDGTFRSFPLVTMEWVDGETLYEWVQKRCLKNQGKELRKAADKWFALKKELTSANIAHGDLQHANVMVTKQGELKLVDYDCMCVPELAQQLNLEIGVDPYQHPKRDANTLLSPELDNFSAIFIYVVLRALAAEPGLWEKYVQPDKYDKLLIRREDFESPTTSQLYRSLLNSPDPEVGRMSPDLFALHSGPIDDVPRLETFLFSYDTVRDAIANRDFDTVVQLLKKKRDTSDIPQNLSLPIKNAFDRVKCRQALEEKVTAGDEVGMQRLYDARLLDDYPKAKPTVDIAKSAAQVLPILQELLIANQKNQVRQFVRIWDSHRQLLDDRKSASAYKAEVEKWRRRNQACDTVIGLLRQSQPDISRLTQAWAQLKQLGGHPDTDPKRQQIEGLIERETAWIAFQHALRASTPTEQSDADLVATWKESLFRGWAKPEAERPKFQAAKKRLDLVKQLRAQSKQPLTAANEKLLCDLAAKIQSGYQHSLASRAKLARRRVKSLGQLLKELQEPTSEVSIVSAYENLRQADSESLLDPSSRARIELAKQRVPLINKLKQISAKLPANQLDAKLLAIWNDGLLKECHDAQPWQSLHQTAVRRKALLDKLSPAINDKNKPAIIKITGDPCLKNYPFPVAWQRAIGDARQEVESARNLLAALKSHDCKRFCELFDARSIKNYQQIFEPYRDLIIEWTREYFRSRDRVGLSKPIAAKSMIPDGGRSYFVRWTFPLPRFTGECILTISRARPGPDTDPKTLDTSLKSRVNREHYEGLSGRKIHATGRMAGHYVAIWAIIDFGFGECISEPFVAGRIDKVAGA